VLHARSLGRLKYAALRDDAVGEKRRPHAQAEALLRLDHDQSFAIARAVHGSHRRPRSPRLSAQEQAHRRIPSRVAVPEPPTSRKRQPGLL